MTQKNQAPEQETISIARAAIPKNLQKEIDGFIKRNAIIKANPHPTEKHCCHQCLKAHLIKKANDFGILNSSTEKLINIYLTAQTGHNGYYLDNDELIRL